MIQPIKTQYFKGYCKLEDVLLLNMGADYRKYQTCLKCYEVCVKVCVVSVMHIWSGLTHIIDYGYKGTADTILTVYGCNFIFYFFIMLLRRHPDTGA